MAQGHDPEGQRRGRAVLIAGPTASGKSALALTLAERFGGVVINADSMQVYRDLRILSARPSAEEEARAPHRLYGTVDAAVNFSAGRWVEAAEREIGAAWREGKPAIVIGGTGLYFKALTEGLSEIPPVPEAIRAEVRAKAEGKPPEALHAQLDPVMAARLRPSDPQRILRALEVMAATGRSLAEWQDKGRLPALLQMAPGEAVFLAVEREALRAGIDRRFLQMMEAGALDEVARLAARGLDPALPAMRAHGVPGLIAHLNGTLPLPEAIAKGQRDTRAYAKRQETWFRHQMPGFAALPPAEALAMLTRTLAR